MQEPIRAMIFAPTEAKKNPGGPGFLTGMVCRLRRHPLPAGISPKKGDAGGLLESKKTVEGAARQAPPPYGKGLGRGFPPPPQRVSRL